MSRAQLTSTVEQNTGGAVSPYVAGKNKIINGDFGIWQRGTSFASPATASYTSDRWRLGFDGTGTCTVSQQTFTPGTAPVAGYESTYFLRHLVTAAGTTTFTQVFQPIEDVRTFAGQTVTFSFWAKADTTRSSFIYAEQNFGSGGSATVQYLSMGSASLTTSWQRFSFTVALSSIAGKTIGTSSSLNFYVRNGTTLNATLDIWGVQLEAGSVATPFTTATNTLSGELAACQRYYWRAGGDSNFQPYGVGAGLNSTTAQFSVQNPVPMRIAPTSIDFSTLAVTDTRTAFSVSGIGFANAGKYASTINVAATGMTSSLPYILVSNNSTSGFLGLSAEI